MSEELKAHGWSTTKYSFSVLTAGLEHLLFCGIIFGWSSWKNIYLSPCFKKLTQEDRESCLQGEQGCGDGQEDALGFNQLFVLSFMTWLIASPFLGIIYDAVGVRLYRFGLTIVYVTGCTVASFYKPVYLTITAESNMTLPTMLDNIDSGEIYLKVAMPMIFVGAMGLFSTNLKLPVLWPTKIMMLTAILSGLFDAGLATPRIAQLIDEQFGGVNRFWLVWAIFAIVFQSFRTLFMMPVRFSIPPSSNDSETSDQKDETKEHKLLLADQQEPTFLSAILQPKFLLHIIWFLVMDAWFNMFNLSTQKWATWLQEDDTSVNDTGCEPHWILKVYDYTNWLSGPMIFIVAVVADLYFGKQLGRGPKSDQIVVLRKTLTAILLTITFGALSSLLGSVQIASIQWFTCVIFVAFRGTVYLNNYSAILSLYPAQFFGKVYGIIVLSTLTGLNLTVPIQMKFMTAESNGTCILPFTPAGVPCVFRCYFLAILATAVYPVYLWIITKRMTRELSDVDIMSEKSAL